ncbi:MAG: hypothetical protein R3A51_18435 [Nannocystaceae bacterium]
MIAGSCRAIPQKRVGVIVGERRADQLGEERGEAIEAAPRHAPRQVAAQPALERERLAVGDPRGARRRRW